MSLHGKERILLTGGSGFIGRNILESFLAQKYHFVAPTHQELDLTDRKNVADYFKDRHFSVVIHAATKPGHRNAPDPHNILAPNLLMVENLLWEQEKFKKFIHLGSGAIYDLAVNISEAREEEIGSSLSPDQTTLSKYIIHQRLKSLPQAVDLNIFGIFGKYEDWQIRFISNTICKALYNLPITLRQNRRFSYVYIDDLMPVLDFFITHDEGNQTFNFTPPQATELLTVAQLVQQLSPHPVEIKVRQTGLGKDYTGDGGKLRNLITDLKFTPMKQAVEELFKYYQTHLAEIDQNLLRYDK